MKDIDLWVKYGSGPADTTDPDLRRKINDLGMTISLKCAELKELAIKKKEVNYH